MNRNTERIMFMLGGALIAFLAYLLGNFDNNLQAQEDDIVTVEKLLVRDGIVVGNPQSFHLSLIAKEDSASISINNEKKGYCGRVLITANGDNASILMSHAEGLDLDDQVNGFIWIETDKSEVAKVLVIDKNGRKDLTTD